MLSIYRNLHLFLFFLLSTSILENLEAKENNFLIKNAYIPIFSEYQDPLAGYFSIKNNTDSDIIILSIETLLAEVSFHKSEIDENEISRMFSVPFIEIPANTEFKLEPSFYHIMISNINKSFFNQKYVNITILTNNNNKIVIPFKLIHKNKKHEKMHEHKY